MSLTSWLNIGSVKTHSPYLQAVFPSMADNIVGYGENAGQHNFFTSLLQPGPLNLILCGKGLSAF